MLKIFALFIVSLMMYSCNSTVTTKPSYFADMLPTDTICKKEMQKAREDLMYNKLVYCNYRSGLIYRSPRADEIIDSLFYKCGILTRHEYSPCIVYEGVKEHCYCEYMNIFIEHKYGDAFVDSIEALADSLYIAEQPLL